MYQQLNQQVLFLVRGAEPDGVSAYARARIRSNGIKDDLQSKRPNL